MNPLTSAFGMTPLEARRAHDIADACSKLIDTQLERLAWREKQSLRERGEAKNLPASDK